MTKVGTKVPRIQKRLNNQGAILTQNGGHLFCVKIRKVEKHNQTYQNKNTVWSTKKTTTKNFFVAHAVRARGSDGHQNVCGRSTILKLWENRWKCKRLDVLNEGNKPNKHPNQTNNQTNHPGKKKTSSELSETKPTLSEQIEPLEHSVPLHDDIAKFRK